MGDDEEITLRKLKNSHGVTRQDCELLVREIPGFKVINPKSGKKGGGPSPRLTYDNTV